MYKTPLTSAEVRRIPGYAFNYSLYPTKKKGKLQNTTVTQNNNVAPPVETLLSQKRLVVFFEYKWFLLYNGLLNVLFLRAGKSSLT